MENHASATEGVENAGVWGGVGEVDHDLGQFWRQHADEGVTLWSFLVAFGVGGDVLGAGALSDDNFAILGADNQQFDLVSSQSELVVVAGSGAEGSFLVGDKAKANAIFLELLLEDEADFLDVSGVDVEAVGAQAERNFAFKRGPSSAVVLNSFLIHLVPVAGGDIDSNDTGFERATQVLDLESVGIDGGG